MSLAALLWLAILGHMVDARGTPRQEQQPWSRHQDDHYYSQETDSQIHRLLQERNALDAEFEDKDRYLESRRKFLASLEAGGNLDLHADSSENELEENDVLGAVLLGDAILEEQISKMPRKFTLHCFGFFLTIMLAGAFCQWVSIKLNQAKNSDSQLDIMMKRQILES